VGGGGHGVAAAIWSGFTKVENRFGLGLAVPNYHSTLT
jgi:hypothetical protein